MIYIIVTTCIHNKRGGVVKYDDRRDRYMKCIRILLEHIEKYPTEEVKPIVVENNGDSDTYLNELSCDVVYTNNNDIDTKGKGVNELMDIHEVINRYNIHDDDIIIKLTGRYRIMSNTFIDTVIENANNFDAFIKFYNVCSRKFVKDDCVLGLYAMRCKYLKNFKYSTNVKRNKSLEVEFATYTTSSDARIMEFTYLHLECCFADKNRIMKV
jgi:hypothetical protein